MDPNPGPFLEPSSLAQLPKAQKTGPFLGPHFGAGKPLLSSFLELQNLDTDREIPSNATSSSLDAAGQVKHPVTACLEHTFAFNSQVDTCHIVVPSAVAKCRCFV